MRRGIILALVFGVAACSGNVSPLGQSSADITVGKVVNVSQDQLSQNETPLAVNPLDGNNLIAGANDWNHNDGCAMNASFNGGKTWTPTLPNGFLPGVTRFSNDPSVPGAGLYDAGGDPGIAFGPDGTAYYICQAFNFTPPFEIALLVSRSTDGGRTWLDGVTQKLTQVNVWTGNGRSKGSNGQFADHESIYVDTSPSSPFYGSVYVTWVEFNGQSHSPVKVAASRDGARTFATPVQVTSGTIRNNQDARLVSAPDGTLYLTFDNGVQGGKGTVFYVSKSSDGGVSWSEPFQFAALNNPVCTFPTSCFNITGLPFRSGGTYPAPAYDPVRKRLVVIWPDIIGTYAQVYVSSAPASDLTRWTTPVAIAPAAGDRFQNEFTIAPNGRYDVSFYDRSYTANTQVDITYAQSLDGGASWVSKRVTTSSFDPGKWGVPSGTSFRPFIGDYNGQYSTNSSVGIAWTGVSPPAPLNLDIDFAAITP
jgi:hypothetical protein